MSDHKVILILAAALFATNTIWLLHDMLWHHYFGSQKGGGHD